MSSGDWSRMERIKRPAAAMGENPRSASDIVHQPRK
jgi:hypothetical protein